MLAPASAIAEVGVDGVEITPSNETLIEKSETVEEAAPTVEETTEPPVSNTGVEPEQGIAPMTADPIRHEGAITMSPSSVRTTLATR